MTELEWLKQESGMTDDEWKAMEAVGGSQKVIAAVKKAMGLSTQALADKTAAENERIALENRYQNEFIPEMRKVTQDSIRAQGELAAARARLKTAEEYGIVPEEIKPPVAVEPRAPGSPDPNAFNATEFAARQSRAIISLNDLNAEHYKLYKEPLGNSQELVDMVQREHTLGHRDFTLQKAWETKYNVPAKRAEMAAADQQKIVDDKVKEALKTEREKHGGHPGLQSGQPSRFSTYKPSDGNGGSKPWQTPNGQRKAANEPWRQASKAKLASAA